nr:hypothetical protein Iba_chr13cCG12990 [Ipomoea batatas]
MQPEGTAADDGEARLPVVASSLLLSFFKATPLADGEAAGDTAKGKDGGRRRSRAPVTGNLPLLCKVVGPGVVFFFLVTMVRQRKTTRRARLIVCRLWHRGEDGDDRHVPSRCFFSSLSDARVARLLLDRRVRITKGISFELFSS